MSDVMLRVFACEAQEKLDEMKRGLPASVQTGQTGRTLDAIFEAVPVIGYENGAVEAGAIETFAQMLENLLDQSRAGLVDVTPEMVGLIMAGCDHLLALGGHQSAGRADLLPELDSRLADGLCDRVAQSLPDLLGRIGDPGAVERAASPATPAALAAQHPAQEEVPHG